MGAISSDGMADLSVLEKIRPYIHAMNIDLKGFTDRFYRDVLKGSRGMVMDFIKEAVQFCHVELTTLIIPGENDSPEEMLELSEWVSDLKADDGSRIGPDIPFHISRFFPRFHMTDREATDVRSICRLKETAEKNLRFVYTGNC